MSSVFYGTLDVFISVVVPVMNEQGNVRMMFSRLATVLAGMGQVDFEVLFVDDGSSDATLQTVKDLATQEPKVQYLSLSRNFGHQAALRCGLDHASGDCVISMDGDLQHPPELIPKLVEQWRHGYDVVYTVRGDDPNLSLLKKATSKLFYRVMNSLAEITLEPGSADFRLLDRSVVDVIKRLGESPIFFRGMIRWLGFKQVAVPYTPNERIWGKSKYSLQKMFRFAFDGITSFSIKPLRLSSLVGAFLALGAFLYGIYAIGVRVFTNSATEGWSSLLALVAFLGGLQLLMIGILGEYVGKLFIEHKKRPAYLIRERSHD